MTKTTTTLALAILVATGCGGGGSSDFDAPHIDQCPTTGRYFELATGMSWTYKVTNNGSVDTKTQTVGPLEDAGGAKAGVMAFRLTTGKPGGDQTVSWQQDINNTVVRQRELDHYMTAQQIDTSFDPSKLRADDTPAHTVAGATWMESYTENVVGSAPVAKTEVWTVVAVDEPVMVPAGAFCTLHVHKASSVGGSSSSDKDYWFARGVGKIKESGAGSNPQTEELSRVLAVTMTRAALRCLPWIVMMVGVAGPADAEVQLWSELGAKWEPTEHLALTLDQDLRFDDDVSRVGAAITEPGVTYRFTRWLRTGAGYRLQYERNKNGVMVLRHRIDVDLQFRLEVHDFRLEYEPQFQEEIRPTSSDQFRHVLRNGFAVEYRGWKPYFPEASVEIFHEFGNPDTVHFDKVWITVGGAWSHKHKEISAFYRAELPQHPSTDPTVHIFSAAFHYDL